MNVACHCICSFITSPKHSVASPWDIQVAQWTHMQSKDLVLLKEQQQSQSACNVLSICEVRSEQQVVASSYRATGHDEEFALSSK